MNIINKVTLKNMTKNKVRTIVTILGIILSAAMICAVTVMVSSLQQFMINRAIKDSGNWFGNYTTISRERLNEIEGNKDITLKIEAESVGYARLEDLRSKFAQYIYVMGIDDNFINNMPVKISKGRLPQNKNEIILPLHLFDYEDIDDKYKIGDKMILNLGNRYEDDKLLGQMDKYESEEELRNTKPVEYTIVGYYDRPGFELLSSPGYTALTMAEGKDSYNGLYDLYFKTKNVNIFKNEYINGNSGNDVVYCNYDMLMYYGIFRRSSAPSVIITLATIITIIIMVGSISLIYNAFAMSVSERTKEFGLLLSIGATKKQLRKSVFFEAAMLSIIGVPIGILSGIGGIWITLMLVGDKLDFVLRTDMPLRICVSPVSVIAAIIVSFVTVLISAWIPSRKALRITAIEAIRLNCDIVDKGKRIKSNKLMYRLFGFEGMIANKYFKRSKRKYRATVLSLFISVVLFIATGYFCDMLKSSINMADNLDTYDLNVNVYAAHNVEDSEGKVLTDNYSSDSFSQTIQNELDTIHGIFTKLLSAEKVDKASMVYVTKFESMLPIKYINDKETDKIERMGGMYDDDNLRIQTQVCFIDDDSYKYYLDKNKLDESIFYNKNNPVALCYVDNKYYDYKKEKFEKVNILNTDNFTIEAIRYKNIDGYEYMYTETDEADSSTEYAFYRNSSNPDDIIKINVYEARMKLYDHKVGFVTYEKPVFVTSSEPTIIIIYPQSIISQILNDNSGQIYNNIRKYGMYFTSDDHNATYKDMEKIREDVMLPDNWWINIYDYTAQLETKRNTLLAINVFSYGFITLITLIAIANVFNTISTNILLRRRDFAMLKSVGLTNKGFNRMLGFECILYGLKSLIYGLPSAIVVTIVIYIAMANSFATDYDLPYRNMIISIITIFIVVFLTMMYAVRKMKKDDPIEGLRNDNI